MISELAFTRDGRTPAFLTKSSGGDEWLEVRDLVRRVSTSTGQTGLPPMSAGLTSDGTLRTPELANATGRSVAAQAPRPSAARPRRDPAAQWCCGASFVGPELDSFSTYPQHL
ncbi:hypothetical protein ACIBO5_08180 [Nonomuraea angiospora]|uniref:hypothetical protein n=1 Tax=Nonomuraea angiospora TaxID=46172 RepID=UPI0037AE96AB